MIQVRVVFLLRKEKERVVEVGAESDVVEEKDIVAGCVRFKVELEYLCYCRNRVRCNGIERYC